MFLLRKINQYILRRRLTKKCIAPFTITLDKNVKCEGGNRVGSNTVILNSSLGTGTYIGDNSFLKNTLIGKYCCIARDVRTINGRHPSSKFVSVHPAFYSTRKQVGFTFVNKDKFHEFKYLDKINNYSVIIENDVWIGEGVRILEGVEIGNGAIVAAGALVTKDVKPYTIVGGIPAKHIKNRFSESEVSILEEIKWWNRDIKWLKKYSDLFDDIQKLFHFMNKGCCK